MEVDVHRKFHIVDAQFVHCFAQADGRVVNQDVDGAVLLDYLGPGRVDLILRSQVDLVEVHLFGEIFS